MDEDKHKSNKNSIGIIIFIIIVFILFTTNIKSVVNSSSFQNNINYIEEKAINIWDQYISKSVTYLWDNIFLNNIIKIDPASIGKMLNVGDIQKTISNLNTGETVK
jgi:hypothetical protein